MSDSRPRRIILSRKGFDSGSGGCPSPLLSDGTLCSLPIPEPLGRFGGAAPYHEIAVPGHGDMARVATALGVPGERLARGGHLDPDLEPLAIERQPGWRPLFGQAGAAASHLDGQGIDVGDLFVFWGLFREVGADGAFVRGTKPFHAVFGWLCVGEILRPEIDEAPGWAARHPHFAWRSRPHNVVYVAADRGPFGLPGAGRLDYAPRRRLTAEGATTSLWRLPADCAPAAGEAALTYHGDPARWQQDGESVLLRTVGRGQEFVTPATAGWLAWAESVLR